MLTSASFASAFDLSKQRVQELKNALKDFLSQEQQDAQDAALASIGSATMATNEKLESMESQLDDIKALLLAQQQGTIAKKEAEEAAAKAAEANTAVEEELFASISSAAGYGTSLSSDGDHATAAAAVPIKQFVMAFESILLKGADLPPEVARGLRIAVDRDNDGTVSEMNGGGGQPVDRQSLHRFIHWRQSSINGGSISPGVFIHLFIHSFIPGLCSFASRSYY